MINVYAAEVVPEGVMVCLYCQEVGEEKFCRAEKKKPYPSGI